MTPALGFPGPIAGFRKACSGLGIRMAVLFGSRATGKPAPGPRSDADIAVLESRPNGGNGFWRIHRGLYPAVPNAELDLVLLSEADPLFRHEIMGSGELLYGRVLDFMEYRAYAYRDWADSRDLRALEDALLAKKLAWLGRVCG